MPFPCASRGVGGGRAAAAAGGAVFHRRKHAARQLPGGAPCRVGNPSAPLRPPPGGCLPWRRSQPAGWKRGAGGGGGCRQEPGTNQEGRTPCLGTCSGVAARAHTRRDDMRPSSVYNSATRVWQRWGLDLRAVRRRDTAKETARQPGGSESRQVIQRRGAVCQCRSCANSPPPSPSAAPGSRLGVGRKKDGKRISPTFSLGRGYE